MCVCTHLEDDNKSCHLLLSATLASAPIHLSSDDNFTDSIQLSSTFSFPNNYHSIHAAYGF